MSLFYCSASLAYFVSSALCLHERMYSHWGILFGILIEYLFLRRFASIQPLKAVVVTVVINIVSSAIGYAVIAWLDPVRDMTVHYSEYPTYHDAMFNLFGWTVASVFYALANTVVEYGMIRFGFRVPVKRRFFGAFAVANLLTVLAVFFTLVLKPVQL